MNWPDRLSSEARMILQPYFPDVDLGRVRLRGKIPWYVFDKPAGYTDRYSIYIDPATIPVDPLDQFALLAHEIEHTRQYLQYGTWRFRCLYVLSYLKNRYRGLKHRQAYQNIDFEIEACRAESRVACDLLARASSLPQVIEKVERETYNV
ncbi:MAG: hypothetical protein IPM55_18455 [Acidobacteria bacterium]|nr:hypothetical protein [Acidobacteriota bacterium]